MTRSPRPYLDVDERTAQYQGHLSSEGKSLVGSEERLERIVGIGTEIGSIAGEVGRSIRVTIYSTEDGRFQAVAEMDNVTAVGIPQRSKPEVAINTAIWILFQSFPEIQGQVVTFDQSIDS